MIEEALKSKLTLTAGFVKAGQKYALLSHLELVIISLTMMSSYQLACI